MTSQKMQKTSGIGGFLSTGLAIWIGTPPISAIRLDDRHDYGEQRWIALGLIDGRLHVLVFTETMTGIRVISFRKANTRERSVYEQAQVTN